MRMRSGRPLQVHYDDLYLYFAEELHNGERSAIERNDEFETRWYTVVVTNCGMYLRRPPLHREFVYRRAPLNSVQFAHTGGDGIHYSFLMIDGHWSELSPIVLTNPSRLGGGNFIVGENLTEFLRLGIRTGYLGLYTRVPNEDGRIQDETEVAELERNEFPDEFEAEEVEALRGLAQRFGLKPLRNVAERLTELQHRYQPLIQSPPPRSPFVDTEPMFREQARERLNPGDIVIWEKKVGGFIWPVRATVIAVRNQRVTIAAEDPDDTGAGIVTRSVSPTSLRLQERSLASPPQRRPRRRLPPSDSLS